MPGTAIVTINGNEWSVNVANITSELMQGLSGIASIPAGTGMLFVLPARQVATIQTSEMLFPIDIIFIKDDIVLSIANNISPGFLVEEATPCDMFLEVNAGEADLVEVGAVVSTVIIQEPVANDFNQIIAFVLPLAILAFVFGMLPKGSSRSSNPQRRLGEPKTDIERKETHYAKYGTKELPERGEGREEKYYWEITDIETGEIIQKSKPYTSVSKVYRSARDYQRRRSGKDKENLVVIRIFDTLNMEEWGKTIKPVMESGMHRGIPILIGKTPLQEAALDRLWPYRILEIDDIGDLTVGSSGKKYIVTTEGAAFEFEEHQSISGEPRRRLVEQYGSWAVGRAEAICPEGDVACVTREAERLIETLRTRYGEAPMRYVTITNAGATVFHSGDTISTVALERENKRVKELGEREATYK